MSLKYRESSCPLERSIPKDCHGCLYFSREWHEGVLCRCDESACAICGRSNVEVTRHHLDPDDREGPVAFVCNPCHRQIHAVFRRHELKQEFDTPEKIRNSERMADFIDWIKGTSKEKVSVSESERVRKWRH